MNKKALFDVKCTKSLADEVTKLGGEPVCYRTGNSYMKAKMREGDFPFGSELSGHVWFRDKWPNIDEVYLNKFISYLIDIGFLNIGGDK